MVILTLNISDILASTVKYHKVYVLILIMFIIILIYLGKTVFNTYDYNDGSQNFLQFFIIVSNYQCMTLVLILIPNIH